MALNIKQITHLSDEYKNGNTIQIDDLEYSELELGKIVKFGYMCEPKAMVFPIYLKIDGEYKKFQIGKTRILEASEIEISGIRVPKGIEFTLDYICDN